MIIRNLTPAGDWTFGAGIQNYLTANAAIAQDISTWLKLWVGNCFFALQSGINYTQYFNKNQQAPLLAALQAGIASRDGVTGINQVSADLDPQSRQMTVTYNISTIYTQNFLQSITIGAPS